MRGGYRPNSGPAKGTKYRPRAAKKKPKPSAGKAKAPPEPTDADKIRQMLAMGTKVRARMYQEFLQRVGRGEKLSLAEKKMMEKIGEELAAEVNGEKPPEPVMEGENVTPLEVMLKGMRDPNEPKETRYRLAIAAAPFIHPRKGEGMGKKEEKNERAKKAGGGNFASMAHRLKLVGNEK